MKPNTGKLFVVFDFSLEEGAISREFDNLPEASVAALEAGHRVVEEYYWNDKASKFMFRVAHKVSQHG